MHLDAIEALVAADMDAVDDVIRERLRSEVVLINQLGRYIVSNGGKRLRPRLVLLAAGAAGYGGRDHVALAAIVEFIHTATLLHDDVVDDSEMRRGQRTANELWGNEAAVLVGDFLYSRAFEMMVEVGSMRVMEILAHATNTIAEGEVMQLLNIHDADTSEQRYLDIIRSKTAKLFEAGCQLGAVLGGLERPAEHALARYGMHLGTAFQVVDDVLDYSADAGETGKNIGDDLAEGKPTLPLIHVIRQGGAEDAAVIREAIEQGGAGDVDTVMAILERTGAIDYARAQARAEAERAHAELDALPRGQYRDALAGLADMAADRTA
ncbi:MAG: polyprenyl synthetase family protein [Halofilum sp. (in: g-proteobacteria)]|nr:polyprenyl synthetase family protein [Halofilum sp. (in: g-proteobacteria)]